MTGDGGGRSATAALAALRIERAITATGARRLSERKEADRLIGPEIIDFVVTAAKQIDQVFDRAIS
jgi:hypothetical protein